MALFKTFPTAVIYSLLIFSINVVSHKTMTRKPPLISLARFAVASTIAINMNSISSALAVSGGGKDFADANLRGQNFNGQSYISKDFTQCDGTGASFKETVLRGSRFYKAKLNDADFSGADLTGVSLEDTGIHFCSLE
jgi:uncharacterized protein YjbI with pentapeptide repeats